MSKRLTLTDDLQSVPVKRRKKIEARARVLIAEELTEQKLRKAQKPTITASRPKTINFGPFGGQNTLE